MRSVVDPRRNVLVPIDVSETKTKSGHPIVRTNFITEVTVADARAYHQKVLPGGTYDGYGHLAVGNVTGVSNEVKKVLGSQKPDPRNPPPGGHHFIFRVGAYGGQPHHAGNGQLEYRLLPK